MAIFTRNGFGQVEANQLSAQKTGQIYASLPLDNSEANGVDILQNGEFMYYDYADNMVTSTPTKGFAGEPMLVFNEIKLYEEPYRTSYKDFAMFRVGDNYVTSKLATAGYGDGALTKGAEIDHGTHQAGYRMGGIAPRLFKTNVGDIYTTNMVATGVEYAVGDKLAPAKVAKSKAGEVGNTLVLTKTEATTGMIWQVVKVYTMPDGQPAVKLQRVQ